MYWFYCHEWLMQSTLHLASWLLSFLGDMGSHITGCLFIGKAVCDLNQIQIAGWIIILLT